MCFGGGGGRMSTPKREFQNRPVTVTGEQTGVDNPKDTAKATETLKIKRQKEEGTYVDPNLTTAEKLTRKSGGGLGAKEKSERSARLRSGVSRGPRPASKAQKAAAARRASKSKR
jgi:hypothetical protein